jgi:hypothetical protein
VFSSVLDNELHLLLVHEEPFFFSRWKMSVNVIVYDRDVLGVVCVSCGVCATGGGWCCVD